MSHKRSDEGSDEDILNSKPKKIKNEAETSVSLSETHEVDNSTSSSSSVPKSDSAFNLILSSLERYEIVWYNSDVDNSIKINRMRSISDYVKFFNDVDTCQDYIAMVTAASDKNTTFLVTSGHSVKNLVLTANDLDKIFSIHCLIDHSTEEEFLRIGSKVRVHTALQSLLKSLLQDVQEYSKTHKNENVFDLSSTAADQESTTDSIESWWPKLIYIIVHLPYPEDCFQRFLTTIRKYYATNPSELRNLDQLERNYSSTTNRNPIEEYTKDTFLYRLVNRSLRQKNIQLIFLFGFFLRDLYQQLQSEHKKRWGSKDTKVTVYRGQIMAKVEVEKLQNALSTVVTSSFMSTTLDPAMSEIYLGTSMPEEELQSVLFEIELSSAEKSLPYADISAISWFPSESETLLMPGLEFELPNDSICYDVDKKIWRSKLKLVSDTIEKVDSRMVEGFGERRKMSYYIQLLIETLTEFCNASTSVIEDVFTHLIDVFPQENWIVAVKLSCLAMHYGENISQGTMAIKHFHKALQCWFEFTDDAELNADVAIGQIYYEIGSINHFHLKENREARDNFDRSIRHFEIAIGKGLMNCEEIKIYELLYEMYGKKLLIIVCESSEHKDENEMKEIQSMIIKYLERYLESIMKFHGINDERISTLAEQLINHYDLFDMYDEQLVLYKKLLKLYQKDSRTKNSEKIVDLYEKIIAIYAIFKNDDEAAVMYHSLLEEHLTGEDTEAADDYTVDYRQNEDVEVEFIDTVQTKRRWSTDD